MLQFFVFFSSFCEFICWASLQLRPVKDVRGLVQDISNNHSSKFLLVLLDDLLLLLISMEL